jgi:hypothetical protein
MQSVVAVEVVEVVEAAAVVVERRADRTRRVAVPR